MLRSDYARKHALECLSLAADCTALADELHSGALQRHFRRMAEVWSDRAARGPVATNETRH